MDDFSEESLRPLIGSKIWVEWRQRKIMGNLLAVRDNILEIKTFSNKQQSKVLTIPLNELDAVAFYVPSKKVGY
ncbi:hypothetical protein [Ammoniphilus resinae]|uniref:DUF2642 domain-containing protein n=1 Tax=Ammoniphilus resinae TaxID=861532 RepID=A0ABS4GU41_9BACL|nr:hypothetical protein [Ammoniphilus resinae]MBP1933793.1 hypothetical protein [Ammoniphilus resinae]